MDWRYATVEDSSLLAELNHQLIADEGHQNPMGVPQLEERMQKWLQSEYQAVLFQHGSDVVAYALYRQDKWQRVCVRQFLVVRSRRRRGVGREAFQLLGTAVFPRGKRITLEVLTKNAAGHAFWRAIGFEDYAVATLLVPQELQEEPP